MSIALAAKDAFDFLGSPEGDLAIAEAIVYLATAPKSNRVYAAWGEAQRGGTRPPAAPVPLHIRNAPTRLMKDLGYGEGYRYAHDEADAYAPQEYLPAGLEGARFYEPGPIGFEKRIARTDGVVGAPQGGDADGFTDRQFRPRTVAPSRTSSKSSRRSNARS